jgi:hypothetical protein
MKTIFWLLNSYPDAKTALDKLIEAGFDTGHMNVLVRE